MTHAPILPPLRRTAADAEAVALVVYEGQFDQAGTPYIEHLERVARRAVELSRSLVPNEMTDTVAQIAWLHDVLEPDERPFGSLTAGDLLEEGFSTDVVEAVAGFLTREPGETYATHIEQIATEDPLPFLIVKLADLRGQLRSGPVGIASARQGRIPVEALRARQGRDPGGDRGKVWPPLPA